MSARTELVIRTALVVTTVLVLLGLTRLLVQITEILLIVLVSAILATGIAPVVHAIERRPWTRRQLRVSRTAAIAVVYLGVLLVLAGLTTLIVTPVVIEAQGFVANLPANLERLEILLQELKTRYAWLPDLAGLVRRLPQEISNLTGYFAPAAGVAFRFLGGIATFLTVLFLGFYMLVEGPVIKRGFLSFFPRSERKQVAGVLEEIGAKFSAWLRGQLLLGLIIGVAAGVGMAIIGMPYAVLLGIVAGITELIPVIGPVLGAIPAVFIAIFQPSWKLIFTIVWYTLIQQTEGNILVPRVMRHAVGLSPLLTILALVIGAKLLGLIGALLAVPVAAALQV
ncbi:MAG: AI-2E family transporter, partial [Gammaproteobacteria bacterium]